MDIAALSTVVSQAKVQHQANLALMDKTMEFQEEQAAKLLDMLNSAIPEVAAKHPYLGQRLDVRL